jgi:hypothetical protein
MMGLSRRRGSGSAGAPPTADQQLKLQVDRVRGLVEALVFDVATWLAATERPVTRDLHPDYAFNELRVVAQPRDRMSAYVSPELLESWGEAIEGWLALGAGLQPNFGRRLPLVIEGLEGRGPVSATVRFPNRSIIILPGGRRQYCGSDWQLAVEISPDLRRIEACTLAPAAGPSLRSGTG